MHTFLPLLKEAALRQDRWRGPGNEEIEVVCKVFRRAHSGAFLEAYLHEHASRSSPSVARFYDQSLTDGDLTIRMELCARGSLQTDLELRKQHECRYTQDYLLFVAVTLLKMLIDLRNARVAHRAIDATNLLFTEDWEIKLTDFGNSKLIEEGKTVDVHTLVGNFGPQESMLAKSQRYAEIDPFKGDLYAFGAVLFEMATLRAPRYSDGMSEDLLELDIKAKLTRAGCPRLWPLLSKLMRTQYKDRISAEEALTLLDNAEQLGSSVRMSERDLDFSVVTEVTTLQKDLQSTKLSGLVCMRCKTSVSIACRALNCSHIHCDKCVLQLSAGQGEVVCSVCEVRADISVLQRRRDLREDEKRYWIDAVAYNGTVKMQQVVCTSCGVFFWRPARPKPPSNVLCEDCESTAL